ncbi:MAG: hypothetical protein LUD16_08160 [Lachnospiraceae bacterium]|nr:hypothetical protein [Lachnospiraceae bacterium]
MKKMTKWYLLLLALAFLIFCALCVWYYMGVRASQPSNAELVRRENTVVSGRIFPRAVIPD